MIPVYREGSAFGHPPLDVTGTPFDVFLQEKLAKEGKVEADAEKCRQVSEAFRVAMATISGVCSSVGSASASRSTELSSSSRARHCRAILFDLDDTLVQTSEIDRAAIRNAAAVAVGLRAGGVSHSTPRSKGLQVTLVTGSHLQCDAHRLLYHIVCRCSSGQQLLLFAEGRAIPSKRLNLLGQRVVCSSPSPHRSLLPGRPMWRR